MNTNKEHTDILDRKVADCDLSVRALCCLKAAGIETVRDLVRFRKSDVMGFRNFGLKTIYELDDFIEDNKLNWGMDV